MPSDSVQSQPVDVEAIREWLAGNLALIDDATEARMRALIAEVERLRGYLVSLSFADHGGNMEACRDAIAQQIADLTWSLAEHQRPQASLTNGRRWDTAPAAPLSPATFLGTDLEGDDDE